MIIRSEKWHQLVASIMRYLLLTLCLRSCIMGCFQSANKSVIWVVLIEFLGPPTHLLIFLPKHEGTEIMYNWTKLCKVFYQNLYILYKSRLCPHNSCLRH